MAHSITTLRQLLLNESKKRNHHFKVGDRVYRRLDLNKQIPTKVGGIVGKVVKLIPLRNPTGTPSVRVKWLPKGNESVAEQKTLVLVITAVTNNIPGSNPLHLTEEARFSFNVPLLNESHDARIRQLERKWHESGLNQDLFPLLQAYRRAGNHNPPIEVWGAYNTAFDEWVHAGTGNRQLVYDLHKLRSAMSKLDVIVNTKDTYHATETLHYVDGDRDYNPPFSKRVLWKWGHNIARLEMPSLNLPLTGNKYRDKSRKRGLLAFVTLSYTPDGISWVRVTDFWNNLPLKQLTEPHFKVVYQTIKRLFHGYKEGHPLD